MRWKHPLNPSTITGKQTLTGDKPVTKIHSAVQELQELVVAAAKVMINNNALHAVVRDNTLEIYWNLEAVGDGVTLMEASSNHEPHLTLELAHDGKSILLGGAGFDERYSKITHDHPKYALGGSANPRELPASANLYDVLYWDGSAWVAGPIRAK